MRFEKGPPWTAVEDMVAEYTLKLQRGETRHELYYYRDNSQYEHKLATYAGLLTALRDKVGTLLDLGCGLGELLRVYSPVADYLGVDVVPSMVTVARNNFPSFNFEIADATKEVLPQADTVVLIGALATSPHPLELVDRACKLAKRNLLFDFLPKRGDGNRWPHLRTIAPDIVADLLRKHRWRVTSRVVLSSSTDILACRRLE